MKKISAVVVCIIVFFAACKQDDTTPPKFNMSGGSTITLSLNTPFNDPGVTADDDEDGSVTVTNNISPTNPNVNLTGHYIITYTATDAAGNSDQITRNVIVVNDAAFMAGAYHTDTDSSTCGLNYTDGIIPSTTINNRIIFNQIGRCTNADKKLMADVDFSTATVTIVTDIINCGTFPLIADRQFSGGGALAFNNTVIDLDITETVLPSGTPVTCRYYFVKQ
jgi:hypothetical protein